MQSNEEDKRKRLSEIDHLLLDPLYSSESYRRQLEKYYSQVVEHFIPAFVRQELEVYIDSIDSSTGGLKRWLTLLALYTSAGPWYIPPLGEIPTGQSHEDIKRIYQETKPGDIVSVGLAGNTGAARMLFRWLRWDYDFNSLPLELMQVHGVILPNHLEQTDSLQLFAPVFQKTRFTHLQHPPDIIKNEVEVPFDHVEWLKVTDAAFAFDIQTGRKISYGQDVQIYIPGTGDIICRATATIDGFLIGYTPDGKPVTGGVRDFHPLPYDDLLTLEG